MIFGVLCQRFPLRTLLWWGTVVAVPQLIPLLFISSVTGALIAAVPIGLMGGVATAAYMDLIIRSCPLGLQGTTLMLAATVSVISVRFGDVLGTALYDRYGNFFICVIAVTVVYALDLADALDGAQTIDINGRRAKALVAFQEPRQENDMIPINRVIGVIDAAVSSLFRLAVPGVPQIFGGRILRIIGRSVLPLSRRCFGAVAGNRFCRDAGAEWHPFHRGFMLFLLCFYFGWVSKTKES